VVASPDSPERLRGEQEVASPDRPDNPRAEQEATSPDKREMPRAEQVNSRRQTGQRDQEHNRR